MTRDDYARIQQMIDATIAYHLDYSNPERHLYVPPRCELFATAEDLDETASLAEVNDARDDFTSELNTLFKMILIHYEAK